MCYGYRRVRDDHGSLFWVDRKDFIRLQRAGAIKERPDGYHFARDNVGAILHGGAIAPMRFDFVPRWFLKGEQDGEPTLAEVLKRKQSKAKGSRGFDSYNARSESVRELASYRASWAEGKRCVVALEAFRERPNMSGAPEEFKGKEYDIRLDKAYYAGCIWDRWERGEERLDSLAILTVDSFGNPILRGIWHERSPALLTEAEAVEWLDPRTTPERAMELCRLLSGDHMRIETVVRPPKPA
jgi:putative SOS response-associated peptidase YedK